MVEKSGIEILEELMRKIDILTQKVDILDQNVKKIANSSKMSELMEKTINTPMDKWARANGQEIKAKVQQEIEKTKSEVKNMRFGFERMDASKVQQEQAAKTQRFTPKLVMVKGKMVTNLNGNVIPLPGISVKIFNDKDTLVKETKTNRAGHWMSQLPAGKYVALFEGEYNGNQLVPQNKVFEVPEGVAEVEVK